MICRGASSKVQPAALLCAALALAGCKPPTPHPIIPLILSPQPGASVTSGQAFTAIGLARPNDAFGFLPCSSLSFTATDSLGVSKTVTPVADPSFQQSGFCDAQLSLQATGLGGVSLAATNSGVTGYYSLDVNVVGQQSGAFVFAISPFQTGVVVLQGARASLNFALSALSGTPQPVHLSVSGLPTGATFNFSSNPATPNGTVTLTISATSATPRGTSAIVITGTDSGGPPASTTVSLNVQAQPQ